MSTSRAAEAAHRLPSVRTDTPARTLEDAAFRVFYQQHAQFDRRAAERRQQFHERVNAQRGEKQEKGKADRDQKKAEREERRKEKAAKQHEEHEKRGHDKKKGKKADHEK